MKQTDLEAAYSSLREIKIKLASLECEFKNDSDGELNGDPAEFIKRAGNDVDQVMLLIYNKF